jgi:hypothetical protein
MAIVKADYLPRGGDTASQIARSVSAYSRGADAAAPPRQSPTEETRVWHTFDGGALTVADARAAIRDAAREAPFTYRLLMSTRDVPLHRDDYAAALSGSFRRWYVATHHVAAHPFARAVAFSDRRLSRADLVALRTRLTEHEVERERQVGPLPPRPPAVRHELW